MKKSYQEMLIKRIQDTILQWENQQQITQDEMYRFFHGLKGTAGSIGLSTWSLVADKQLDHFHQHSQDAVSQSLKASALQSISNLLMEDEQIVTKSQMSATLDKNYVILIIDDDIIFVSNLKEILENEGITVFVAPTAKKGLELFFTLQPNFVLIDLHLHNEDGFNILKQISSQAMHQFIPIAVVTSHASKENLALAYELGTTDFIGKPLDFEKFIPYVKNRIQFKEKILHSISTDELTGAFNRKQLSSMIPYHIQMHKKLEKPLTIAMLDLDFFKKVNDTYGHLMGDEVLKKFVQTIQSDCTSNELLFRYGGEEFALLFLDQTSEQAYERIQSFRSTFSKISFTCQTESFHVTFSAGLSSLKSHQTHYHEILEEADTALYHSKRSGRDRSSIYSEDLQMMQTKKHLRIFIIDDDAIVRNLLVSEFMKWTHERFEFSIYEFENGLDFVNSDWYSEDQNHIILLDSLMPQMAGIEVLTYVRSKYSSNNVLISMLSAQKQEENILTALELGADDYLLKPFHPKEVVMRIQRLAERLFLT